MTCINHKEVPDRRIDIAQARVMARCRKHHEIEHMEPTRRMFLILPFAWSGTAFAQHSHGSARAPTSESPRRPEHAPDPARPTFFEGEVQAVDKRALTLTLRHSGIPILDMPAATEAYPVKGASILDEVSPGDKIRFTGILQARQFIVTKVMPAH